MYSYRTGAVIIYSVHPFVFGIHFPQNGVSSVPPPYPANSAPPPLSAAQPTLIDFGADEPPVPNAYAQPAPVTSSGDMSQQFSNLGEGCLVLFLFF